MIRTLLAVALVFALAGCETTKKVTREAYAVPIPYVPNIPEVARPANDLDSLTLTGYDKMTPAERGLVIKAYVKSAEGWRFYALALESIVNEMRQMGKDVEPVRQYLISEIGKINAQAAEDFKKATAPKLNDPAAAEALPAPTPPPVTAPASTTPASSTPPWARRRGQL
jgi:hypothetical protein